MTIEQRPSMSGLNRDVSEDGLLEEAIGWAMAFREGSVTEDERVAFDGWMASDVRNQQIWQRLDQTLASFQSVGKLVSGTSMIAALEQRQMSRRATMAALGTLAVGGGALAMFSVPGGPAGLVADMRTGTAERRRFNLPDATALTLDARSRANLAFGTRMAGSQVPRAQANGAQANADTARGIALLEGTAFASVQPGATPFRIDMGPLRVSISSGNLIISHRRGQTRAITLEGLARFVLDGRDGDPAVARAGMGYKVVDGTLLPLSLNETMDAASWLDGRLVMHDRTLGELVDAIRPYESGFISVSPEAAAVRTSGVFDLTDLDGALSMIGSLRPLRIIRLGGLFCHIGVLA